MGISHLHIHRLHLKPFNQPLSNTPRSYLNLVTRPRIDTRPLKMAPSTSQAGATTGQAANVNLEMAQPNNKQSMRMSSFLTLWSLSPLIRLLSSIHPLHFTTASLHRTNQCRTRAPLTQHDRQGS